MFSSPPRRRRQQGPAESPPPLDCKPHASKKNKAQIIQSITMSTLDAIDSIENAPTPLDAIRAYEHAKISALSNGDDDCFTIVLLTRLHMEHHLKVLLDEVSLYLDALWKLTDKHVRNSNVVRMAISNGCIDLADKYLMGAFSPLQLGMTWKSTVKPWIMDYIKDAKTVFERERVFLILARYSRKEYGSVAIEMMHMLLAFIEANEDMHVMLHYVEWTRFLCVPEILNVIATDSHSALTSWLMHWHVDIPTDMAIRLLHAVFSQNPALPSLTWQIFHRSEVLLACMEARYITSDEIIRYLSQDGSKEDDEHRKHVFLSFVRAWKSFSQKTEHIIVLDKALIKPFLMVHQSVSLPLLFSAFQTAVDTANIEMQVEAFRRFIDILQHSGLERYVTERHWDGLLCLVFRNIHMEPDPFTWVKTKVLSALYPGHENEDDCAICLQSKAKQLLMGNHYCTHTYHATCLLGWMASKQPKCPLCKREFAWPA